MNKCHYIHDTDAGNVLIPGCWPVVHTGRMEECTCRDYQMNFKQFEKKEYNDILTKQNLYIKELEKENAELNRVIKKLCKNKASAKPTPA